MNNWFLADVFHSTIDSGYASATTIQVSAWLLSEASSIIFPRVFHVSWVFDEVHASSQILWLIYFNPNEVPESSHILWLIYFNPIFNAWFFVLSPVSSSEPNKKTFYPTNALTFCLPITRLFFFLPD